MRKAEKAEIRLQVNELLEGIKTIKKILKDRRKRNKELQKKLMELK